MISKKIAPKENSFIVHPNINRKITYLQTYTCCLLYLRHDCRKVVLLQIQINIIYLGSVVPVCRKCKRIELHVLHVLHVLLFIYTNITQSLPPPSNWEVVKFQVRYRYRYGIVGVI